MRGLGDTLGVVGQLSESAAAHDVALEVIWKPEITGFSRNTIGRRLVQNCGYIGICPELYHLCEALQAVGFSNCGRLCRAVLKVPVHKHKRIYTA
jgi:hypothetical protein